MKEKVSPKADVANSLKMGYLLSSDSLTQVLSGNFCFSRQLQWGEIRSCGIFQKKKLFPSAFFPAFLFCVSLSGRVSVLWETDAGEGGSHRSFFRCRETLLPTVWAAASREVIPRCA